VCCSVLQCVAVCCIDHVLGALRPTSVLQCVAVCCIVLQCVSLTMFWVRVGPQGHERSKVVLQRGEGGGKPHHKLNREVPRCREVKVCCSVLQCVAVCRSVLQCVAVCCSVVDGEGGAKVQGGQSVLQCVAVCRSVLQCVVVCRSVLQCCRWRGRCQGAGSPGRWKCF